MMPKHLERYWEKRLSGKIEKIARARYLSNGIYLGGAISLIEYLLIQYLKIQ